MLIPNMIVHAHTCACVSVSVCWHRSIIVTLSIFFLVSSILAYVHSRCIFCVILILVARKKAEEGAQIKTKAEEKVGKKEGGRNGVCARKHVAGFEDVRMYVYALRWIVSSKLAREHCVCVCAVYQAEEDAEKSCDDDLLIACWKGDFNSVQTLLDRGTNPRHRGRIQVGDCMRLKDVPDHVHMVDKARIQAYLASSEVIGMVTQVEVDSCEVKLDDCGMEFNLPGGGAAMGILQIEPCYLEMKDPGPHPTKDGKSGLMLASEHGHGNVIVTLLRDISHCLDNIANADSPRHYEARADLWASFRMACRNGHEDIAAMLISAISDYGDLDTVHWQEENDMFCYIESILCHMRPKQLSSRDVLMTSLMVASEHGLVSTIDSILKAGSKLDAVVHVDSTQRDAVLFTEQVSKSLLRRAGADPEVMLNNIQISLMLAIRNGHCQAVRVLIAATKAAGAFGDSVLKLARALSHGNLEMEVLLYEEVDLPLHAASIKGDVEGVKQLIHSRQADPHSTDEFGRTALMLASMRGLTSMVVLLLKSGLKPEAEDTFYTHFDGSKVSAMSKNTSLIIACKFGHEKAAEALIAPTKAANALDARSASGATARIWATHNQLTRVVEMLDEAGATQAAGSDGNLLPFPCSSRSFPDQLQRDAENDSDDSHSEKKLQPLPKEEERRLNQLPLDEGRVMQVDPRSLRWGGNRLLEFDQAQVPAPLLWFGRDDCGGPPIALPEPSRDGNMLPFPCSCAPVPEQLQRQLQRDAELLKKKITELTEDDSYNEDDFLEELPPQEASRLNQLPLITSAASLVRINPSSLRADMHAHSAAFDCSLDSSPEQELLCSLARKLAEPALFSDEGGWIRGSCLHKMSIFSLNLSDKWFKMSWPSNDRSGEEMCTFCGKRADQHVFASRHCPEPLEALKKLNAERKATNKQERLHAWHFTQRNDFISADIATPEQTRVHEARSKRRMAQFPEVRVAARRRYLAAYFEISQEDRAHAIKDVREFLLACRRKNASSVEIKKGPCMTKFLVWQKDYYSWGGIDLQGSSKHIFVNDGRMADKLRQALPTSLEVIESSDAVPETHAGGVLLEGRVPEAYADVVLEGLLGKLFNHSQQEPFNYVHVEEEKTELSEDQMAARRRYLATYFLIAAAERGTQRGRLKEVCRLLEVGAEQDGWTALMHASLMGRIEVVVQMLDKGADVNAQDKVCGGIWCTHWDQRGGFRGRHRSQRG